MFEGLTKLFNPSSRSAHSNSIQKPNESAVSVRSPEHFSELDKLIEKGPITFILVHADWCGPCQSYKPLWSEMEQSPGRIANMAMVHHDMVENSALLKKAKIPGFPTVLKVHPNGKIEEYISENKKTNAVPNIRDKKAMISMLKEIPNVSNLNKNSNSVKQNSTVSIQPVSRTANPGLVSSGPRNFATNSRVMKSNPIDYTKVVLPQASHPVSVNTPSNVRPMKGGALFNALLGVLNKAGPASILFAASQMLPPKKNTGSSMRRTRKAKKGGNRRKSRRY
jgi:thiol-disulfide isomerase/thioredoxin